MLCLTFLEALWECIPAGLTVSLFPHMFVDPFQQGSKEHDHIMLSLMFLHQVGGLSNIAYWNTVSSAVWESIPARLDGTQFC